MSGSRKPLTMAMRMAAYGESLGALLQRAYEPSPLPIKGSGYRPRYKPFARRSERGARADVVQAALDNRARKAAKRVRDRDRAAAGHHWLYVARWQSKYSL